MIGQSADWLLVIVCVWFLRISGWLQAVADDKTKAYCSYCKVKLHAHYKDLERHCHSHKHRQRLNSKSIESCATFSKGIAVVYSYIFLIFRWVLRESIYIFISFACIKCMHSQLLSMMLIFSKIYIQHMQLTIYTKFTIATTLTSGQSNLT